MKKFSIISVASLVVLFSLAYLTGFAQRVQLTTSTSYSNVVITQNLEESGYYWTQFNLPPGGELMELDDSAGYWAHRKNELGAPDYGYADYRVTPYKVFYGTYCCEWPEKYAYEPADRMNENVSQLVFFAADGSIWVIPVPASLLTQKNGETTVTATIYR